MITGTLRNTDDRDVKDSLNFLQKLRLMKQKTYLKKKNINNLKILLANEATKFSW